MKLEAPDRDPDPELRALLARARQGMNPSGVDEERVLARTQGALALAPSLSRRAWVLRTQGAMPALALGIALGVGFRGWWGKEAAPVDRSGIVRTSEVSSPAGAGPWGARSLGEARPEENGARLEGPRASATRTDASSETQSKESKRERARTKGALGATPAREEVTVGASLDEVATVREVQRALVVGNAALALQILTELDRELPKGRLLEERAAARAIANCSLRPSEGRSIHGRFVSSFSQSVHEARVRKVCDPGRDGSK